eukprot:Blabericola_migrator_1__10086@NODE_55_length_16001_cov_154_094327_g51_i0_p2_GENE_NODE_55_length_16001_cov_154_094327_g51_i0NODE_55_length_16001_cov_154_094327_g51_i0_p2_ORF_typecomplete_len691_score85_17SEFIR/PF08357_11/0_33_NODE_55_length_16001_cov_154_094327_g51_i01010812180
MRHTGGTFEPNPVCPEASISLSEEYGASCFQFLSCFYEEVIEASKHHPEAFEHGWHKLCTDRIQVDSQTSIAVLGHWRNVLNELGEAIRYRDEARTRRAVAALHNNIKTDMTAARDTVCERYLERFVLWLQKEWEPYPTSLLSKLTGERSSLSLSYPERFIPYLAALLKVSHLITSSCAAEARERIASNRLLSLHISSFVRVFMAKDWGTSKEAANSITNQVTLTLINLCEQPDSDLMKHTEELRRKLISALSPGYSINANQSCYNDGTLGEPFADTDPATIASQLNAFLLILMSPNRPAQRATKTSDPTANFLQFWGSDVFANLKALRSIAKTGPLKWFGHQPLNKGRSSRSAPSHHGNDVATLLMELDVSDDGAQASHFLRTTKSLPKRREGFRCVSRSSANLFSVDRKGATSSLDITTDLSAHGGDENDDSNISRYALDNHECQRLYVALVRQNWTEAHDILVRRFGSWDEFESLAQEAYRDLTPLPLDQAGVRLRLLTPTGRLLMRVLLKRDASPDMARCQVLFGDLSQHLYDMYTLGCDCEAVRTWIHCDSSVNDAIGALAAQIVAALSPPQGYKSSPEHFGNPSQKLTRKLKDFLSHPVVHKKLYKSGSGRVQDSDKFKLLLVYRDFTTYNQLACKPEYSRCIESIKTSAAELAKANPIFRMKHMTTWVEPMGPIRFTTPNRQF